MGRIDFHFSLSNLQVTIKNNRSKTDSIVLQPWFGLVSLFILTLLSILTWYYYYQADLTLSYNDARSHLNIGRRIFDNLQPGFAQIGSVWLPLFHVLELPFVANDFLWRSGIAGSVISMVSYVLGGVFLFGIVKELDFDKKAIVAALLVYALNPNLMFMQTTPMTESLLIFLSTASVYYILKWVKRFHQTDLILAGFYTFLATLTRYDGWFLFFFIFLIVIGIGYKKRGFRFAEGSMFLYASLAGLGVVLWFFWNWVIFGDPLFFATGPFSAKSQQDVLLAEGRLYSKGNLLYSTYLYTKTVIENIGYWVFFLSVLGSVLLFVNKKISWQIKLVVGLLLVPFVFNVFSLVAGHSVIHLPTLPPYTWFNDRYGLMVLPAVAVFIAYLVNKKATAFVIVSLVLSLQLYWMYATNSVITIEDGVRGASGQYLDDASAWISQNITDGLILVAASSNDALLFKSNLPLKQFITEGARKYWDESLIDPTVHAQWIIMHKGDLVYEALHQNPLFLQNYRLVYKDRFTYIYTYDQGAFAIDESQLPQ